ncbi:hypothetical protein J6590_035093 [Homalodisca vitripennis]|nr:hypothetical protein J6590_035093 [Homalodisca vitripennis]
MNIHRFILRSGSREDYQGPERCKVNVVTWIWELSLIIMRERSRALSREYRPSATSQRLAPTDSYHLTIMHPSLRPNMFLFKHNTHPKKAAMALYLLYHYGKWAAARQGMSRSGVCAHIWRWQCYYLPSPQFVMWTEGWGAPPSIHPPLGVCYNASTAEVYPTIIAGK